MATLKITSQSEGDVLHVWKKVLICVIIAILSLAGGFGVGYMNQHGGFDFIHDLFGKKNTEDDSTINAGRPMTTGAYIANMRMKPDATSDIVATLEQNTEVTFVEDYGDWTLIALDDGREGYVATDFLTFLDEYDASGDSSTGSTTASGTLCSPTTAYLNLRSGPSMDYDSIGIVYQNDKVLKLGEEDGWFEVQTADGTTGYISGDLTTEVEGSEPSSTPVPTAVVINDRANVRAAADIDSDIVTTLYRGDETQFLTSESNWCEVLLDDGRVGWIRNDLIELQGTH